MSFSTPSRTRHTSRSPSSSDVGLVRAVVTQNIDTLHSRAGSRDVVEVHGSIRSAVCLQCLWTAPADDVLAQLETHATPLCVHCGEVLKPGVTLFGELLPAGAMEQATDLVRAAGLVLVVGSSLEVWPVAGLPLEARAYAIVNRGPTALDDGALVKVDAFAGETLAAVVAALAESDRSSWPTGAADRLTFRGAGARPPPGWYD